MSKFQTLKVWDQSLLLIKQIYDLCSKIPISEKNNLIDQIKRSATSVSLNIAEGSASQNDKEFVRYLRIAKKSLSEVLAALKIIPALYHINIVELELNSENQSRMLSGLINYLEKNK